MQHVFLSGGAYGANWLWMIIPFVAFIVLVKLGQMLSKKIFDVLSHIRNKANMPEGYSAPQDEVNTNL